MLRRIINLWRISGIYIPKEKEESKLKKMIKDIIKPHAKIVKMDNPIEELNLE